MENGIDKQVKGQFGKDSYLMDSKKDQHKSENIRIVLVCWQKPDRKEYVVWTYNDENKGFHNGTYCTTPHHGAVVFESR